MFWNGYGPGGGNGRGERVAHRCPLRPRWRGSWWRDALPVLVQLTELASNPLVGTGHKGVERGRGAHVSWILACAVPPDGCASHPVGATPARAGTTGRVLSWSRSTGSSDDTS